MIHPIHWRQYSLNLFSFVRETYILLFKDAIMGTGLLKGLLH